MTHVSLSLLSLVLLVGIPAYVSRAEDLLDDNAIPKTGSTTKAWLSNFSAASESGRPIMLVFR